QATDCGNDIHVLGNLGHSRPVFQVVDEDDPGIMQPLIFLYVADQLLRVNLGVAEIQNADLGQVVLQKFYRRLWTVEKDRDEEILKLVRYEPNSIVQILIGTDNSHVPHNNTPSRPSIAYIGEIWK